MKRFLAGFALLVVLGATVLGGAAFWAHERWVGGGPSTEDTRILIPRGAGLRQITLILDEAGLFQHEVDRILFPVGVKVEDLGSSLQAGEYDIPAGAGLRDIALRLSQGKGLVQHAITVAEGLTTHEALELVRAAPLLEGEVSVAPGEGDLLPETYHFLRGDSRDAVIGRMMASMDGALDELWATRRDDLPIQTKEEAVILASIVEKETAIAAERPRVAAVFINRLRKGMPLQSDPTVIYGLTPETGSLGRPLLRKDLKQDHPYNTYTRRGLPVGPIANPGRDALAAVLNPPDTTDLYFVADGSGGHAFAKTLKEHNSNVAKWRRVQRERRDATSE